MLGLGALWILLQVIQWDSTWSRMDDDAAYILHARSLVENHQYNDPNFVYSARAHFVPLSTLPGWPLMLTPIVAIFGVHLGVMKLLIILIAIAFGGVIYRLLRDKVDDGQISLLVTASILFSMTTIVFSRVIYSEWPFMLLSIGFIILFLRREDRDDFAFWAAMGVLLGVTLLLRSVAYALVLSAIVMMILEGIKNIRRRKSILKNGIILVITAIIVSQGVTIAVQPQKGAGYKEQILARDLKYPSDGQATVNDLVKRVYHNGRAVVSKMVPLLLGRTWHEGLMQTSPRLNQWVGVGLTILGGLLTFLVLVGLIRQLMIKPSIIEFYIILFLGMNALFWLYTEVYRYLMPIVPFLFYYLWQGGEWIFNRFNTDEKRRYAILIGALWFVVGANVIQAGAEVVRYRWSENGMAANLRAVQFLKENTDDDELIIADDSRWWALEVSKPVTTFLNTRQRDEAYQFIAGIPNAILVVDSTRQLQRTGLIPVIEAHPEKFQHIIDIEHLTIYRHVRKIPPNKSEVSL